MSIGTIFRVIKMLYSVLWYTASLVSFMFNAFWLCCTLASAGIPWATLLLVIVCIASKFFKLSSPNEKQLNSLLGGNVADDLSFWPIAHRGGAYDAPENSAAAIKKVLCVNAPPISWNIYFFLGSSVRKEDFGMCCLMPGSLRAMKS